MNAILHSGNYREITKENIIHPYQVAEWLYILDEVNSARMYLLLGRERALLFDTGFAFAPLKPVIRQITDLPLDIVCSHGHDDHILGCYQFDEAYLGEEDYALCVSNDNEVQRGKQIASRRKKTPNIDEVVDKDAYYAQSLEGCRFRFVKDGNIFDLGGLTLQVFPLPGHTRGSIALYCKEKRALFSGDAMMKNHVLVYAQSLDISSAPQEFIAALTRLEKLDVDTVWPAHGDTPAGADLIRDTRQMLIHLAHEGDVERDRCPEVKNRIFGDPNAVVCQFRYKDLKINYNPGHLDQIRCFMQENDGAVE